MDRRPSATTSSRRSGAMVDRPLMIPQTTASTAGELVPDRGANSTMDAITRGTRSGLELFLIVVAMLLVLVALVFLVNAALALLPDVGGQPISLVAAFRSHGRQTADENAQAAEVGEAAHGVGHDEFAAIGKGPFGEGGEPQIGEELVEDCFDAHE